MILYGFPSPKREKQNYTQVVSEKLKLYRMLARDGRRIIQYEFGGLKITTQYRNL